MKYALILPDGAADEPIKELNGRTALQAANTPTMDWIAQNGRVGTVRTVPEGFLPGSDVATLSVLGYDPSHHYTGRGPIEAAARDLQVGRDDVVFRCNLTTIIDDVMVDFSAGHISQPEAVVLIDQLNESLADERITFHAGVMYRHLMVLKGAAPGDVSCTPPHDIPGRRVDEHMPRGPASELIIELMFRSREILDHSEINRARRESGRRPATSIWLWGQGRMPQLPSFESRFGLRGACITAVDLIRGMAKLIGWPILEVEGATGYLDTDYAAKGQRAVQALGEFDLVCVHIEAPDEAGHNGDAAAKVEAIERIDEHIVAPVVEELRSSGPWKCLVVPDHPTPVARRTHTADPPPFCLAGSNVVAQGGPAFCERNAENSGLQIAPGHQLMEYFLHS